MLKLVDSSFDSVLDESVSFVLDDRDCFGCICLDSGYLALSQLALLLGGLQLSKMTLLELLHLLFMLCFEGYDSSSSGLLGGFDSLLCCSFLGSLRCDESLNDNDELLDLLLSYMSLLFGFGMLALHRSDHRLQFPFKKLLFNVTDLPLLPLDAKELHHLGALLVADGETLLNLVLVDLDLAEVGVDYGHSVLTDLRESHHMVPVF